MAFLLAAITARLLNGILGTRDAPLEAVVKFLMPTDSTAVESC
jgi:hypothetical protein